MSQSLLKGRYSGLSGSIIGVTKGYAGSTDCSSHGAPGAASTFCLFASGSALRVLEVDWAGRSALTSSKET